MLDMHYAAVLFNFLTSFLFPAGMALGRGCDGRLLLPGDEAGADPGRHHQRLRAPLLSTTEGDGLVMGLLGREAKFCVLVKDNYSLQADTLSLDPPRRFMLR